MPISKVISQSRVLTKTEQIMYSFLNISLEKNISKIEWFCSCLRIYYQQIKHAEGPM